MPKISIIVPVYNTEKYLRPCLDSILAQTFTDFEAILVDDGSKDQSGIICDEYAAKDNRFVVVHKQNGGVAKARNTALGIAKGEWISFADGDDELLPTGIETLYASVNTNNDLISASYVRYEDGVIIPSSAWSSDKELPIQDFMIEACKLKVRCCERYLVTKLFKKSIIDEYKIIFNESLAYREDVLFLFQYLIHCTQNVSCINKEIYIYYRRSTGAAMTHTSEYTPHSQDIFYSIEQCLRLVHDSKMSPLAEGLLTKELITAYYHVLKLIDKSGSHELKKEKRDLWKKLARQIGIKRALIIHVKELLRPVYHKIKKKFPNHD